MNEPLEMMATRSPIERLDTLDPASVMMPEHSNPRPVEMAVVSVMMFWAMRMSCGSVSD